MAKSFKQKNEEAILRAQYSDLCTQLNCTRQKIVNLQKQIKDLETHAGQLEIETKGLKLRLDG